MGLPVECPQCLTTVQPETDSPDSPNACPECGQSLTGVETATEPAADLSFLDEGLITEPVRVEVEAEPVVEGEPTVPCPMCGTLLVEGVASCHACGELLKFTARNYPHLSKKRLQRYHIGMSVLAVEWFVIASMSLLNLTIIPNMPEWLTGSIPGLWHTGSYKLWFGLGALVISAGFTWRHFWCGPAHMAGYLAIFSPQSGEHGNWVGVLLISAMVIQVVFCMNTLTLLRNAKLPTDLHPDALD